MNHALELPRLGAAPRAWTLRAPAIPEARAALALHQAGHLPRGTGSTTDLLRRGLDHWLRTHSHGVLWIRIHLAWYMGHVLRADDSRGIELSVEYPEVFIIGPRLERCEAAVPGLGSAVLYWIAIAGSTCGIDIVRPAWLEWMAIACHWGHNNNENDISAELAEEGAPYEGITRAEFDRHYPAWSVKNTPALKDATLRTHASKRSTVGRVARALLALISAIKTVRPVRINADNDVPMSAPALVLRWRADDLTDRLVDDWYQDQCDSGVERDAITACELPAGDDTGARLLDWLEGIKPMFPVLRALEHLIEEIKQ